MAEQDDISPWARDDWSSDPPVFESSTPPNDPARPAGDRPPPPRPHGAQVWIAAAFGAVLLIGGVAALVRNDSADREATGSAGTVSDAEESSDTTGELIGAPTTTTATAGVPTFWNDDPVETTEPPSTEELAMAASEVGEVPTWNMWSIDVPEPLDAMSVATEVVAFGADGTLYRIEVPSGQVRAMRMSSWDAGAQAVVGEDAIVVFTGTSVTIIRDDEPIIGVPMSQGVIFVEAWPASDKFIVTTPSLALSGAEQQLILGPDGALVPIERDLVIGNLFSGRVFLPDGRVAFNRPGGVYAVGVDQPTTRLSDGDIVATGTAHYAVQECDEALRCTGVIVDAATGERTDVMLGTLGDGPGFADPSSRISPDGRKIVFTDRTRGIGVLQLLDVATGSVIDLGRINELIYSDSWAGDSSGVFAEEASSIVFHPADRVGRVLVEGLDDIASVATRPASSGG